VSFIINTRSSYSPRKFGSKCLYQITFMRLLLSDVNQPVYTAKGRHYSAHTICDMIDIIIIALLRLSQPPNCTNPECLRPKT